MPLGSPTMKYKSPLPLQLRKHTSHLAAEWDLALKSELDTQKNNTRDFCLIICWSLLYIPLEMVMFLNDNLLTWDGLVCSLIWIILTEISGTCLWVEIHRIGLLLTLENNSEGLSLWVVSLCCLLSLWYHVGISWYKGWQSGSALTALHKYRRKEKDVPENGEVGKPISCS